MSVDYRLEGSAAVITIDRPSVGILTGAAKAFCAGADLRAFDLVDAGDGFLGFTRLEVGKPTIAAVEGHAVAGGLELALWCDLRVVGRSAVFGCFERRFGVPLVDGGTQRLPRLIGMGRAMEMVLTGRPVGAEEALRHGLANRVVPDGAALITALGIAGDIAAFPQATVRSDRRAMLDGWGRPLDEALELERQHGSRVMEVAIEGARRFAAGEGRHGAGVEPRC